MQAFFHQSEFDQPHPSRARAIIKAHQGEYESDAALANHCEARLVGDKWYRNAIWLTLFPFFQLTRPTRLKASKMWDRWFFINFACAAMYDAAVVYLCGSPGFVYLAF